MSTKKSNSVEPKIEKSTIVRTAVFFVATLNTLLNAFGYKTLPFTSEEVSVGVAAVFDVVVSVWAWWKNNSFTKDAIEADRQMRLSKKRGTRK